MFITLKKYQAPVKKYVLLLKLRHAPKGQLPYTVGCIGSKDALWDEQKEKEGKRGAMSFDTKIPGHKTGFSRCVKCPLE